MQSYGIWERIRRLLAVDPSRSTGVPLNPQFRNPPPGANPPELYDDPVTVPAGDIADNPYWKRDVRRNYPRLSVVNQADVAGLLTVGSAAAPKEDVLLTGDAGTKQLVEIKEGGEEKGLSAVFANTEIGKSVLGENGMPPLPAALGSSARAHAYEMDAEDQPYPTE